MAVKKRIVYYLSGFDPRGVRYYHALYKEHFQKQSAINGLSGIVSPRKKLHNHLYQWDIDANDHGRDVHTQYRFLSWDDIIRTEWSSGIISYYKDLIYCIVAYIFNGLVVSFAKASPKQMMAAFYPVVYLLGIALGAWYAAQFLYDVIGGWIGAVSAIAGVLGVFVTFERIGNQIGVFWLLRIYAFSVRWGRGEIDTIEERIDRFADEIRRAVRDEDADEVLLVSHSVGTILSVSVLARALERAEDWNRFGMVTLGECIPLVSFQPDASGYRNELKNIANHPEIIWLDYTAPIDGACFPLHDFMKSAGIDSVESNLLLLLSPRFHTLFDKMNYKKLRRDWYTTHFLYLMSQDKAGDYDFFAMTAGAENIRTKFKQNESR